MNGSSSGMLLQESAYPASPSTLRPSDEALLEELRLLATPTDPIEETELMAPLPLADWKPEKDGGENPWS